jgi:dihydrodipicolinate synthase/N-acetylneuraminate lyase
MKTVTEARQELTASLFSSKIPLLWVPPLTHYRENGDIDLDRMSAHLAHMVPWIKGYLIPGSTSDGWELSDEETDTVVRFGLEQGRKHSLTLLFGVLKAEAETMARTMEHMLRIVKDVTGVQDPIDALKAARVCGFAVCPPRGKTLSQEEMYRGVSQILDMGLPVALYQLPQMTENEVAPETVERLILKYPNLIMCKDSSGQDRIATSRLGTENIFLVRGAEGEYAKWLKGAGGPYDGFLLSSANCFAQRLNTLIESIENGHLPEARTISDVLSVVLREVFVLVESFPHGNAFSNANRAIDHYNAFGPEASRREGPLIHAKVRLPREIISGTGSILNRFDMIPATGYVE